MFFPIEKISRKFNLALVLPAVLLTVMGLVSIFGMASSGNDFYNFKKQAFFFALSLVFFFLASVFDWRFLKTNSYFVFFLYLISVIGIAGLMLFGMESRGVRGWYKIGPFSLDPMPFAAIALIIVLSKYFSTRHIETKRFQPILFSGLYVLIPFIFILAEPDLGSSLILISVWIGMIIFSGIKFRHFLILTLIFLILFGFAWQFWFKDYHKQRIINIIRPNLDPKGISWNVNQSKIAIGSGGFLGKGIGRGSQTQYGFLPEPETDFVFSAIAEETGFLGISFLLFLLFLFFTQSLKIALRADDNFTKLFAAGFAFMFLSQSFINISMSFGLLPVIGIPLPFVSYGGSQILAYYVGLGILESLSRK